MLRPNNPNKELEVEDLRKMLSMILENLLAKNKLELSQESKQHIISSMANMLKYRKCTYGHVMQPTFLAGIIAGVAAAVSTKKTNAFQNILDPENGQLLALFKKKGIDLKEALKLSPEDFKKLLKEKFSKDELQLLHGQFLEQAQAVIKDMEKFELDFLKPTPESAKKLADDLYVNLFGLMSSTSTGSLTVPVECYIGNGLGINDWNPNHGDAPIDSLNKASGSRGDPLGLVASAKENYRTFEGNTLIKDVMAEYAYERPNPNPTK